MSRKKGQTYTAEQKTKIVLELLKEEATAARLATKYKVSTQTLGNWKKQFLENASLAFEPAKTLKDHKAELSKLQHENDELAKKPGKTTIERDWAVEKLKSLDLSDKKDLVDSRLETLSLTRQCELLRISRSSYYYEAAPMSVGAGSMWTPRRDRCGQSRRAACGHLAGMDVDTLHL